MKSYSDIMKKWSDRLNMDDLSLASLVSTPVVMFTGLAYYMTLILATFVALFFKVANVQVYGVAYIWGLIAIPMSISTTFSILRGWGLLMGLALLWPFVTSLFLAIFASLFANAAGIVAEDTTINAAIALSNIYRYFRIASVADRGTGCFTLRCTGAGCQCPGRRRDRNPIRWCRLGGWRRYGQGRRESRWIYRLTCGWFFWCKHEACGKQSTTTCVAESTNCGRRRTII